MALSVSGGRRLSETGGGPALTVTHPTTQDKVSPLAEAQAIPEGSPEEGDSQPRRTIYANHASE